MLRDTSLILVSSMLLSLGFMAFNQPPLLGYILAGTIVGPAFTQVIENPNILHTLGEFGLILLLFLVGLEVNLEDFKRFWVQTLVFLATQFLVAAAFSLLGYMILGWAGGFAILVAFILTVSSTAVVIMLLENMGLLQSRTGAFAVSVLIAQDLALMPMILVIRSMNGDSGGWINIFTVLLAIVILIFAVLYFGKPNDSTTTKLYQRSFLRRSEITNLIGASVCFVCATLADSINLSPAYGAFLAGLMLGNRWDRELLLKAFIPVTSLMMMVFFLSVGVRVSLGFIGQYIDLILGGLGIVVAIKMLANIIGLRLIGWPKPTSLFAAGLLAQMSEFSFVLVEEANKNDIINYYSLNFLIALTTLSLAFGSILPLAIKSMSGVNTRASLE